MNFIHLSLFLILLSPVSGMASDTLGPPGRTQTDDRTAIRTLLLPINIVSRPRINLSVTVPEGYKALQSFRAFSTPESTMIEFIPEKDRSNNWTEIITVNKFLGKGMPAKFYVDSIKSGILSNSSDAVVLSENTTEEVGYRKSSILLKYKHKNRTEIIGVTAYSGPYDCIGIQYTIRPKSEQSVEEIKAAIEKYFNENIAVIPF